ncbi:MAG: DUF4139 domain-containing protein, partial [Treponema sp.]|nr:DUF4139 domain-containing protein [Treponema sp.]
MYNKKAEFLFFAPVLFLTAMTAFGQPSFAAAPAVTPAANAAQDNSAQNNTGLPLKRLALFSSGVGFFQHSGNITGTADSPFEITLPFSYNTVNDVLKSLTVNDPASALPSVNYAASDTLDQTLKSLAIDLSGNPGMAEILNSLKGAEVTISGAPGTRSVEGRIVGVEYRSAPIGPYGYPASGSEPYLTLFTAAGLQSVKLEDYSGFLFADEKINSDLRRALDLLLQSGNSDTRNLTITLPGEGSRDVSISYVIPAPVWKISYRLDLSSSSPLLQGWAIVDNDSDSDWNNIELSLVTGRPVSFIQNLYDPYHTVRPTIPLAIAGVAESRSYDSGYGMAADEKMSAPVPAASPSYGMSSDSMSLQNRSSAYQDRSVITLAGGTVQTAAGNAAGDQFEFTFKQPVNVPRRQSAMLPLMESG